MLYLSILSFFLKNPAYVVLLVCLIMSDHLRRNPIKTFKKELSVYKRGHFTEKDNLLLSDQTI